MFNRILYKKQHPYFLTNFNAFIALIQHWGRYCKHKEYPICRKMKTKLLVIAIVSSLLFWQPAHAQKITTIRPYVQEQSQQYVDITKVELTNDYTIIYFTYQTPKRRPSLRDLLDPNNQNSIGESNIRIDPKSRLYEPQNVNKKFRFIKAEGIPLSPKKLEVYAGDKIQFVVYFERLDPGIEVFDMYEGQDHDGLQFWNFYGVNIRNPKAKLKPKPVPTETPKAEPPVIAEKTPAPAATPAPALPLLATVRGTVINAKTKQPVSAKISYAVPNEDNGLDSLQLSASSGKFKLNVSPNLTYPYVVSAKGYFPASGTFDLSKIAAGQELTLEIPLTPATVGEAITLNKLYFDVSKYEILPASYNELDRLVDFMKSSAGMEVRVEGHTDNLGDFDENVKLSLNRANAVKQYLVSKGISPERIETKGIGPTRPISKGTSETERRRNRRVELMVLKLWFLSNY